MTAVLAVLTLFPHANSIDAIPKNPSGKILRRQLRDQAKKLPVESRAKL